MNIDIFAVHYLYILNEKSLTLNKYSNWLYLSLFMISTSSLMISTTKLEPLCQMSINKKNVSNNKKNFVFSSHNGSVFPWYQINSYWKNNVHFSNSAHIINIILKLYFITTVFYGTCYLMHDYARYCWVKKIYTYFYRKVD